VSKFVETIEELDAGLFLETAQELMKAAVRGVVATGKKGNLTLKFDLERIGESASIKVSHDVSYTLPTKNGKLVENKATATVLHADNFGNLSITPQSDEDQELTKAPVFNIVEKK